MSFSELPQVEKLLQNPSIEHFSPPLLKSVKAELIRHTLEEIRERIRQGKPCPSLEMIVEKCLQSFQQIFQPQLKKAINATGIVLHTNLGRAPLGESILLECAKELSGYCTLEVNTETASRGKRGEHLEEMLCSLTGAEAALFVNNGAAGVFLILNALSFQKEVVISRGELVQIGGGFRMPEILTQSGAVLKEIGTTNITHLKDYEKALNENTQLILKVHPSCFHISGHTESVSISDLSQLSKKNKIPLSVDWGSGSLTRRKGKEKSIQDILKEGADLLSFSGDKLFGSSQAGIVIGKKEWVSQLKSSPLYRAFRLGKLDLFVLEKTVALHLQGKLSVTDQLLQQSPSELDKRSDEFIRALHSVDLFATKSPGKTPVGGGSTPHEELDSILIRLKVKDSETAARTLSQATPPVFTRKDQGEIIIDLRTVFPEDEPTLIQALRCLS